jgi:phosphoesterase RecJ-like protein
MNSLRLLEKGKLAISHLTYEDIQKYPVRSDDFEGLVNIGRNLEGVEVSMFLREDPRGVYRGNLRSNNYVDVSKIAENFKGGGHKRAAGFNAEGDLENVIRSLVETILPEIRGKA